MKANCTDTNEHKNKRIKIQITLNIFFFNFFTKNAASMKMKRVFLSNLCHWNNENDQKIESDFFFCSTITKRIHSFIWKLFKKKNKVTNDSILSCKRKKKKTINFMSFCFVSCSLCEISLKMDILFCFCYFISFSWIGHDSQIMQICGSANDLTESLYICLHVYNL